MPPFSGKLLDDNGATIVDDIEGSYSVAAHAKTWWGCFTLPVSHKATGVLQHQNNPTLVFDNGESYPIAIGPIDPNYDAAVTVVSFEGHGMPIPPAA